MPRAHRNVPLHLQIAGHYKRLILDGEIRTGQRLPTYRKVRDEWGVSLSVVQQAYGHLKTEGLIRGTAEGTFADGRRAKRGPQQRIRAMRFPVSERVEVLAADLVAAPGYIAPDLGLTEVKPGFWPVIRREWVTYEDGGPPFMLSVSWCKPEASGAVPELLAAAPLPDPGGEAALIAARTGREITGGMAGWEARPAKDDGREVPLLRLPDGAHVLAMVCAWWAGDDVLAYQEDVLPEGRVIECDLEP